MHTETIKRYIDAGLSVVPVGPDKRPRINWRHLQDRTATPAEYAAWTLPIAIVCGAVSGNLLCIDFDDNGSLMQTWAELVKMIDPDILSAGYCQRTPSGGYHFVVRVEACPPGNTKLASRIVDGQLKCLIETRGNGGYFVVSPSDGYRVLRGDVTRLQPIPDASASILLDVARSLDEAPKEFDHKKPVSQPKRPSGITPFDEYDASENPVHLLCKHGWAIAFERNDVVYLLRPGKVRGISATWNHVPDRFYVFSTNTKFETQHVYKASAVYALLEHAGDFSAAAKELAAQGYGDKLPDKTTPVDVDTTHTTTLLLASDFEKRIRQFYAMPRLRGLNLGMHELDRALRFDAQYLNVITGIPGHGKSEVMDWIMVLLAVQHDWTFTAFSPENYPIELHFDKLASKYLGRNLERDDKAFPEAMAFVDRHFRFVDVTEKEMHHDTLMNAALEAKTTALLIDPWNELDMSRPKDMNESDYIGYRLMQLRKFARKNNMCVFIVAHPAKMYRPREGNEYPVPSLYDISGSGHWYNKADNGIVVHRNFEKSTVSLHIKKVKFRQYGKGGEVTWKYEPDQGGRFSEVVADNNFDTEQEPRPEPHWSSM